MLSSKITGFSANVLKGPTSSIKKARFSLEAAMASLWIAIILITVSICGAAAYYLRSIELENAEREINNIAFILAEQTAYYAQNVDLILLQYRGWHQRATAAQIADPQLQHEILREAVAGATQIRAMSVYNAQGQLLHSSVLPRSPLISVEDRDFFRAAQNAGSEVPVIGAPVISRLDKAWVLTIGRRLTHLENPEDFQGLVAISFSSDYFRQFYRSIKLGPGGRIMMMDYNRKVQVVEPPDDRLIGTILPDLGPEGRIVSEQLTRGYPFVISVELNQKSALQGWRSQVLFLMTGGGVLILLASVFLGVVRLQLTRQTQLSNQLRQAHDDAVAANQARADFLARMSHELRTPMTGVLGISDQMLADPLPAEQRRRLLVLSNSARALLTVINDILDFSKIDAGRLEVEAVPFDWIAMLTELDALLRGGAEQKGLTFVLETPATTGQKLIGDALRLKQILINLIGNAIKFTHHGSVTVKAAITTSEQRGRLTIEIKDTGVGITPEQMSRLFRPFEQADITTTRRFGGTGLGLAISDNLLRLMGGAMLVDSEPGQGTRFQITLDLPIAPPETNKPRFAIADIEPASLRGLSVLLAEDNEVNRELIVSMLSAMFGHHVIAVADGAAAVEEVRTRLFDVALLDIHMPVMDGIDAIRAIRELPGQEGHLVAIALTADAILGQAEIYKAAGFDECVTKPINWVLLGSTIDRLKRHDIAPRPSLSRTTNPA